MKRIGTGRILSGLVVAFLLMDLSMKLLQVAPVVEGAWELPLGVLQLVLLAFYLVPRTAPLGAIAAPVRMQNSRFSYILIPVSGRRVVNLIMESE